MEHGAWGLGHGAWGKEWTCNKKVDSQLRVIMQLVFVLGFVRLALGVGNLMPNAAVFGCTISQ